MVRFSYFDDDVDDVNHFDDTEDIDLPPSDNENCGGGSDDYEYYNNTNGGVSPQEYDNGNRTNIHNDPMEWEVVAPLSSSTTTNLENNLHRRRRRRRGHEKSNNDNGTFTTYNNNQNNGTTHSLGYNNRNSNTVPYNDDDPKNDSYYADERREQYYNNDHASNDDDSATDIYDSNRNDYRQQQQQSQQSLLQPKTEEEGPRVMIFNSDNPPSRELLSSLLAQNTDSNDELLEQSHPQQLSLSPPSTASPCSPRSWWLRWWRTAAWIALISWLLPLVVPPAPPPPPPPPARLQNGNNNIEADAGGALPLFYQDSNKDLDHGHHHYQHYNCWKSYFSENVGRLWGSLHELAVAAPLYIGKWWYIRGMDQLTALLVYPNSRTDNDGESGKRQQPCSLRVHSPHSHKSTSASSSIAGVLSDVVVGQPAAVEVVTEALQAWSTADTATTKTKTTAASSPLLIYLAGYEGSGKTTLALSTAQHVLFRHCPQYYPNANSSENNGGSGSSSSSTTTTTLPGSPVLILEGEDFGGGLDESQQRPRGVHGTVSGSSHAGALQEQLARCILRHLGVPLHNSNNKQQQQQRLDGAVVVLRHADRMNPAVLVWLLRELSGTSNENDQEQGFSNFSPPSPGNPTIDAADATAISNLREHCQKVVFFFTSSTVGLKSISRNLRMHNGTMNQASRPGLTLDLQHEVDVHLDQQQQEEGGAGGLATPTKVSHVFHAMAPFVPLAPKDLEQVLRNRVDEMSRVHEGVAWRNLVITDALVTALLDPSRVEYIQWNVKTKSKKQTTQTPATGQEGSASYSSLLSSSFSSLSEWFYPSVPEPETSKTATTTTTTLLTYSSTGGKVLADGSPISNKLKAAINRCFLNHHNGSDGDENEYTTKTGPRFQPNEYTAVLDYDGGVGSNGRDGVLKWCRRSDSNKLKDALFSRMCTEACRFLM